MDNVSITSDSLNKTFKKVKYDYILHLRWQEAGDMITLENQDDSALEAVAARLNTDVLRQMLETIGQQPFTVDSFDSTHVKGHINVTEPGTFVLSVAYEPGWTLKVDGRVTEIDLFDEMFISTPLDAGEHTIEISFFPAGLKGGMLISLISIAVLAGILWAKRRRGRG